MLQELRGHHEAVEACIFLPGASVGRPLLVASASRDCSVKLWDGASGGTPGCKHKVLLTIHDVNTKYCSLVTVLTQSTAH